MASTDKTTNYELSQFLGTDKPSWLGDYNGDNLKIDTAIKASAVAATDASTTANAANVKADAAKTIADTASTTAQSAFDSASEASTLANAASATATEAGTKASTAITDAEEANTAAVAAGKLAEAAQTSATAASGAATRAQTTAEGANTVANSAKTLALYNKFEAVSGSATNFSITGTKNFDTINLTMTFTISHNTTQIEISLPNVTTRAATFTACAISGNGEVGIAEINISSSGVVTLKKSMSSPVLSEYGYMGQITVCLPTYK